MNVHVEACIERQSYTNIVRKSEQRTVISAGEPGSISSSAASTPEAVFLHNNNRKQYHYYQRKLVAEATELDGDTRTRGTKRKRHCKASGDGEDGDRDIEAQIASLEEATQRGCPLSDDGTGIGGSQSAQNRECTEAELVHSVEAQIERMELLNVEREDEIVAVPEVEDLTTSDSNTTDLSGLTSSLTMSGPRDRAQSPSPALSAYAVEFSPEPQHEQTTMTTCQDQQHQHPMMQPVHCAQNPLPHAHVHQQTQYRPDGGCPPQPAQQQVMPRPCGLEEHGHDPFGHGHGHMTHNGYPPTFYEQHHVHALPPPPPSLMDGPFGAAFVVAPEDQNVNRWETIYLQQQRQAQMQSHCGRPPIVEMGGSGPRQQRHRRQRHRGQHHGGRQQHTTPPFQVESPSSSSSGMNNMSLSSRSNTPFESLGQSMDGEFFVSIDVECAATGHGHFDSAPCRIAMVDFFGTVLFDQIANVPHLMDPLTEFTGLRADQIINAPPLEKVLRQLHCLLAEFNHGYRFGVTIVGQSLIMDLIWTELNQGVHYNRAIDIAQLFKTKAERWSKPTYYSLRQAAWGLMGCDMNGDFHDPTEDARVTMQLYRECCLEGHVLEQCKQRLQELKWKKKFPDFKVRTQFYQCSGMYNPSRCHCGQETAIGVDGVEHIEKLRTLYNAHRKKPVLKMQMPAYAQYHH